MPGEDSSQSAQSDRKHGNNQPRIKDLRTNVEIGNT